MRLLLGGLLLLALFAGAALWQSRWTAAARSSRDLARQADGDTGGWSKVIVGRPSGDEPVGGAAEVLEGEPANGSMDAADPGAVPANRAEVDAKIATPAPREAAAGTQATGATRHVVRKGETLSDIARSRYGTARREVVDALARHNRLADANALREGQEILLPSLETLLGRRP